MTKIVGVRFQTAGKIYYFGPKDYALSRGSHVIVETARGTEYGTVIFGPKEVPDEEVVSPLKDVIRIATPADDEREANNRFREREAFLRCKQMIREHNLDMKLIKAEYTFDNNKLLFYFTADGRVDFRELVKDLAGQFHTRIELRQIGVRDETKLIGGLGICGRELCCHTFLSDFAPVSIKMAKEQNLSLNPTKISGTCGRLMCCLNNEAETYKYLNRSLPKNGTKVFAPDGTPGIVRNVNILRQTVKVVIEKGDEREIREYSVEDLIDAEAARAMTEHGAQESVRSLISTSPGSERNTDQESGGGKQGGSRRGTQNRKRNHDRRGSASESPEGARNTAGEDRSRDRDERADSRGGRAGGGSDRSGRAGGGSDRSGRANGSSDRSGRANGGSDRSGRTGGSSDRSGRAGGSSDRSDRTNGSGEHAGRTGGSGEHADRAGGSGEHAGGGSGDRRRNPGGRRSGSSSGRNRGSQRQGNAGNRGSGQKSGSQRNGGRRNTDASQGQERRNTGNRRRPRRPENMGHE